MRLLATLPLLASLGACAGPNGLGGQTGEEFPVPCLIERVPLGWDEAPVSVGQSVAQWVGAWPEAGWSSVLTWSGGSSDALAITLVVAPETATLVVQEPSAPEIDDGACQDLLEVDAALAWTSGVFAEEADVTIRSEGELGRATFALPDGARALAAAAQQPDGDDPVLAEVSVVLAPTTSWGEVTVFGTASQPGVWVPLATWGESTE